MKSWASTKTSNHAALFCVKLALSSKVWPLNLFVGLIIQEKDSSVFSLLQHVPLAHFFVANTNVLSMVPFFSVVKASWILSNNSCRTYISGCLSILAMSLACVCCVVSQIKLRTNTDWFPTPNPLFVVASCSVTYQLCCDDICPHRYKKLVACLDILSQHL